MSERVGALLQASGLTEPLIGSLERHDVLFVLTGGTLLYQDASGTRRVTLRDLTRIHSDQDGLLRVETPAGTALTASLLGFDPVDVQTFFGQVRDTTARVKQAALAAPLTSTAPAPLVTPPPTARPATQPPVTQSPATQSPAIQSVPSRIPAAGQSVEESVTVIRPAAAPGVQPVSSVQPAPTAPPIPPRPQAQPAPPAQQPGAESKAPATKVPRKQPEPQPEVGAMPPLVTPVPIPAEAGAGTGQAGTLAALAGYAQGTRAWAGRLRFLSVLLFVAALGLAFVQFTHDQKLQALWVLIAGGIGAVALLALADLTRLICTLAAAYSERSGTVDAD